MSILIKGMEIPENCGYCRFRYDGICHALQKTKYNKDECPLVSVPPHGRLIDADALLDDCIFSDEGFKRGMYEFIGDAPTIIEAESE